MQTSEEHTLKQYTLSIHSVYTRTVYTQTTAHTKWRLAIVHAFYVEFLGLASDMIFPSFKVGKDTRVGKVCH